MSKHHWASQLLWLKEQITAVLASGLKDQALANIGCKYELQEPAWYYLSLKKCEPTQLMTEQNWSSPGSTLVEWQLKCAVLASLWKLKEQTTKPFLLTEQHNLSKFKASLILKPGLSDYGFLRSNNLLHSEEQFTRHPKKVLFRILLPKRKKLAVQHFKWKLHRTPCQGDSALEISCSFYVVTQQVICNLLVSHSNW